MQTCCTNGGRSPSKTSIPGTRYQVLVRSPEYVPTFCNGSFFTVSVRRREEEFLYLLMRHNQYYFLVDSKILSRLPSSRVFPISNGALCVLSFPTIPKKLKTVIAANCIERGNMENTSDNIVINVW